MGRPIRPWLAASAALLACVALERGARAQGEPGAADVSAARELGKEGIRLADANKCAEAIDKLARAEKLYHAPTILGRLGECQVRVGKIVLGTENLQRVVHEALPANPPPQFVKARERAQKVLSEAQPKIGKLKIVVNAPPKVEVTIKIDGEVVSSAFVGAERPTDPGEHFVEATAPGYLKSSETVVLKEAGSDSVVLTLKVDPEGPPPPPPDDHPKLPPPVVVEPPPSGGSGLKTVGWISLAVGGAGLVVGTIGGVAALSAKSDLDRLCGAAKSCPSSAKGTLDSANTAAAVSTVGFIIGAVGVAAGVTFLLLPSSSPKAETPKAAWVRPYAGPTELGLVGAF